MTTIQSATALMRGAVRCLTHAPSRRLAIIPFFIGIAVSVLVGGALVGFFQSLVGALGIGVNQTGYVLGVVYQILLGIGIAVATPLVLLILVVLLSAYFQVELAQTVFRARGVPFESSQLSLSAEVYRAISHECRKLLVFLPFSILALITGFIPPLLPIAFLIGAFLLGAQFLDVAMEAKSVPSSERIVVLKSNKLPVLVFGAQIALITIIPFGFVIISPIATAGAAELLSDQS